VEQVSIISDALLYVIIIDQYIIISHFCAQILMFQRDWHCFSDSVYLKRGNFS